MKIKSSFGPKYSEYEIGEIIYLAKNSAITLSNGFKLQNFPLAYQKYGELNEKKDNAILICHALTADQYIASKNPITGKDGWWDWMVGASKPIDTNKYFVICVNVLGGCMGSFGPKTIDEKTGEEYGLNFPFVTIFDIVKSQKLLIEEFGIEKLKAVIGGSAGGMQALAWSILYPKNVDIIIPIATSYKNNAQNVAFHEVGRQAIMADANWAFGEYYKTKIFPSKGLSVARMAAHITYMSQKALESKFGRNLQNLENLSFSFKNEFQIESYLHHQGNNFAERFDPNSYLYITKSVDYYDLEKDCHSLNEAFFGCKNNENMKFLLISFSDDWLFSPSEMKKITKALLMNDIKVSAITIESENGHDSFLIENESLKNLISGYLG